MEKVEKHLDKKREGVYLLLLHQRISVRYGSDIVRGLGLHFFPITIHFIQVFIRISS